MCLLTRYVSKIGTHIFTHIYYRFTGQKHSLHHKDLSKEILHKYYIRQTIYKEALTLKQYPHLLD